MSHDHQHHQTAATTTSISQPTSGNNANNSKTTYRPCSPDLSAFVLPPQLPQQRLQQKQSLFHPNYRDASTAADTSRSSAWQQQQRQASCGATLTGLPGGGSGYPLATHRGSYDASPYFSPQGSFSLGQGQGLNQGRGSYFVARSGSGAGQQQGQVQRRETLGYGTGTGTGTVGEYSRLTHRPTQISSERFGPGRGSLQQQQQLQTQSQPGFTAAPQDQLQSLSSPVSPQYQQQPQHNMPPSRRKRGQTDDNGDSGDFEHTPEASTGGAGGAGGKPSRKRKSDSGHAWTTGRAPGEVRPSLGIDIKTKFPVARIKRIMQADEDVGKVAQATPTAVSKALELFMITLVTKAAAEAQDRSSKRVTAAHLKQAVIKDQTFDFLQEIIEKVPDPTEKKGGGRAASEDLDDGGGGPAKRKRAPRGKKKADSDED